MQRERSALNSFLEPIDLNQGSLPGNTSMDHATSWENMLNPVENRLSSYMLTPADGNANCLAANNCSQSFNGWDRGESSSSARNMQVGATGDNSKMRIGWSSSFHSCSSPDARPENLSVEPSNISSTGYVGSQVTCSVQSTHSRGSNCGPPNVGSNHGLVMAYDRHSSAGARPSHCLYEPRQPETETIPALDVSSSSIGTSSVGFTFPEANVASSSSFGTWGSSCKRKALEGTSGQLYPGGSSSSNQQKEKNIMQHPVSYGNSSPGTLSISSGMRSFSSVNHSEQLNPSTGHGTSRISPGHFPSSVLRIAESSGRNFNTRSDHGQHESVPFDAPEGASMRNFGVYAAQMSRPISNMDCSELRLPMNQNNPNHPNLTNVNEARGMLSYPWDRSCGSRGNSSSSSYMVFGGRGSGAREEVNVRSSHRNSLDSPETRNILPDEIDWSYAPATFASSRNHSSGSRVGLSAGGQTSSAAWSPYQSQVSPSHQRLLEPAPWLPLSHAESESGIHRNPFAHLPSSSDGAASTNCSSQHQVTQNSAAFLMAMPSDEINGWHSMTAVEERHRLIRQVLNAMRRGVRLQSEDYMFADPFINGIAELHDRHRDMRLDVDNMSYEELLSLEERIGNVSTGLSKEKIRDSMKQRKYEAIEVSSNLEPCCICQEEYIAGDGIGILDCGHEFHTSCIEQWLMMKKLCPICKIAALET